MTERNYEEPVSEAQEALLDDLRDMEWRGPAYMEVQELSLSWPEARRLLHRFVLEVKARELDERADEIKTGDNQSMGEVAEEMRRDAEKLRQEAADA